MNNALTLLRVSKPKAIQMAVKLSHSQKDWDFLGSSILKQVKAEVTPPGYENIVRALKNKKDIGDPYPVAWAMYGHGVRPGKASEAAVSYSGASQLLRAPKNGKMRFVPFANDIRDNAVAQRQQQHEILRKERRKMRGQDIELHHPDEREALPPGPDKDKTLDQHRIPNAKKSPPKGYPKDESQYADPKNHKYPIDTEERVRSAMSYFSQAKNQAGYTSGEIKTLWGRIIKAAKKFGIEVSDNVKKRAGESARPESVRYGVIMREASVKDGYNRIETVIMTEGMGNRKDRHFYPASTIQRDYKKFEGKASFVNHQDEEEAQIRPERDLRDQIGWWENVKVSEDGREMTADLVFEKTTVGQYWFDKCKSAIDYSQRYPGQVWFAVSINADGRTHVEQTPDGEEMNVVDEITEVDSVDLVTKPALQTKFIRVLESYRDAVNKNDERRQSMSLREAQKEIRAQLRDLRNRISTANTSEIPELQESIRQVYDELADATVISRGSVRILESAKEIAEHAQSEKDLTPLFVAWNNLLEAVKADEDEEEGRKKAGESKGHKKAGEHGYDDDEEEEEGRKRADEAEGRKKAADPEDDDDDGDEDDDNAKFGKKVARAARETEDDDSKEEAEDEAEAKLTKALRHVSAVKAKLHMAMAKRASEDEGGGSGDGGSGDYKKNVADAHKALKMAEKVMCSIMGKKASESDSEDEEEAAKKSAEGRKRAEEAAKRRLGNLRENFKHIPANVLNDVYKATTQRIREAKQRPTYEADEAARVVSSKLEMINALLESENIPMKARFSLQPKLLNLETEEEMRAEIVGQKALVEAFSAGGFAGMDWKPADIIGAPARSNSTRESSVSGKSGWAAGVTD